MISWSHLDLKRGDLIEYCQHRANIREIGIIVHLDPLVMRSVDIGGYVPIVKDAASVRLIQQNHASPSECVVSESVLRRINKYLQERNTT